MRRCADGVLEVADMGACQERAAAQVRMLRECVQVNSDVIHPEVCFAVGRERRIVYGGRDAGK